MKLALPISLILAVLTTVLTWWPRSVASTAPQETREGKLLNKGGEKVNPDDIQQVKVLTWNNETKSLSPFEVKRQEGAWLIPSKYNYPADGGKRVGQTAGGVVNVVCGPRVSASKDFHAQFGVLDPETKDAEGADARGKHVTLSDGSGKVLVDLIIGKSASEGGASNVYYVREAGDDTVYTAAVKADVSTKFEDWVETDLLKLYRGDVRRVSVLDYSIDEKAGKIEPRATTVFARTGDATDWTTGTVPPGQIVNQETVNKLLDEVTGLRLVDVQPFRSGRDNRLNPIELAYMGERGFFVDQQAGLPYGKEGALEVVTKDGVLYKLFFGNQAADAAQAAAGQKDKDGTEKDKKEAAGNNRYMALFVGYEEKLDESQKKPEEKKDDVKPGEKPDPAKVAEKEKQAKEAADKAKAANSDKATKAMRKFLRFFYVIKNDSFKKLRPEVKDLYKEKPKEEKPKDATGAPTPGGAIPAPPPLVPLPPAPAPEAPKP